MKRFAYAFAILCAVAAVGAQPPAQQPAAAGLTGAWAVPDTPWSIVLKQDGTTLTGKVVQGVQEFEIYEAKVDGATVSFKAQPPTRDRIITFVGKVSGDEIAFTRTFEIKEGGAPGGPALMGGPAGPPEFKALRAAPDTDVWSGTVRNAPNPNNPNAPPPVPRPVTVGLAQAAGSTLALARRQQGHRHSRVRPEEPADSIGLLRPGWRPAHLRLWPGPTSDPVGVFAHAPGRGSVHGRLPAGNRQQPGLVHHADATQGGRQGTVTAHATLHRLLDVRPEHRDRGQASVALGDDASESRPRRRWRGVLCLLLAGLVRPSDVVTAAELLWRPLVTILSILVTTLAAERTGTIDALAARILGPAGHVGPSAVPHGLSAESHDGNRLEQ